MQCSDNFENEYPCYLTRAQMDTLRAEERAELMTFWEEIKSDRKPGDGKSNEMILGSRFPRYCELVKKARAGYREILADQK